MPSDDAVRHTGEPELIRTPDQLQQAKSPDAPAPAETVDQGRRFGDAPQSTGILGQLAAERAHD